MQLIIHGLTGREKRVNKSSASNQGPISHQAQSPKVNHTIAPSRQGIKNFHRPPLPDPNSFS